MWKVYPMTQVFEIKIIINMSLECFYALNNVQTLFVFFFSFKSG